MKYNLLARYLVIPLVSLGITATGICETYLSGEIEQVNAGAQQCSDQLPADLYQARQHFKKIHSDNNIPKYYLMAEAGLDQRHFLSNSSKLKKDLKNPYANSQLNIEKISQRVADSVLNALYATRTPVEREYISLIQGPGGLSTYKEHSEVLAALTALEAPGINTVEDNSQSAIQLLLNSQKYTNSVTEIDSSATASYLHKKLGLTIDDYHAWRDDFFESSGLYNKEADSLHQLTRFISYLVVRNQYNNLASAFVTGKSCEGQNKKDACQLTNDLFSLILPLMRKASEQLILTLEDWLSNPKKIQPCFNAGCDSWLWYYASAIWSVKPVQHSTPPHSTDSGLTYWYDLSQKKPNKAREAIQSFKTYMEHKACWEYGRSAGGI